ncbi:MAG: flagellar protein FlaG [Acidobacteriota bacterium]|nr:flagellar protein FlaG [Acidobacteriota bacterium]
MEIYQTLHSPAAVQAAAGSSPDSTRAEELALNRRLHAAVRTLNDLADAQSTREFSFAIDPKTRQAVIRIVDTATHEVIEQIPSEYILRVAQQLKLSGSTLNSRESVDETV